MDFNSTIKQLTFSHKIYGPINFTIPGKDNIGYWKACSFIGENGEIKFKVVDRHGHSKVLFIRSTGTIGYTGKPIPNYVYDAFIQKIEDYDAFFKAAKVIHSLN